MYIVFETSSLFLEVFNYKKRWMAVNIRRQSTSTFPERPQQPSVLQFYYIHFHFTIHNLCQDLLPIFKISLRLWTATEILRLFGNVWWQKPLLCLEQSSLPPNCQFFAQPILFSKAASSNINFILQDNDFIWQKAVSSSLQVKTVLSVFAFIADLQTSRDPDHKRPPPPVHHHHLNR